MQKLSHRAPFVERNQRVLACIASVAILMVSQAAFSVPGLMGDAAGYWALSSLLHFGITPTPRGYLFPLLLMPLRWLSGWAADPMAVLKAGLAVIYGVLLPLLVPAVFRAAFGGRISFLRRLVPVVLLALIFPGLLVYPLSDVPALLMTMGAVLCCIRAWKSQTFNRQSASSLFAAGCLMGAAYNTRPVYQFCLLGLGLFVAFAAAAPRTPFNRLAAIALFAAGVLLISLPQLVINKRTHGMATLAVTSGPKSPNLFASQLVWGIAVQRYESSLGPIETAFYHDPAGIKLLSQADYLELLSIPRYVRFVLQNPADFIGIYSRHLLNGLDVRDGQTYTSIPSPERTGVAAFNFGVLAFAFLVAATIASQGPGLKARSLPAWTNNSTVLLCILLLPVAATIPGAVETRFFLPLHLLAYCVIAAYFDSEVLLLTWGKHAVAIVLTLVLVAGGFFAVSFSTMSQLQYAWPDNFLPGRSSVARPSTADGRQR